MKKKSDTGAEVIKSGLSFRTFIFSFLLVDAKNNTSYARACSNNNNNNNNNRNNNNKNNNNNNNNDDDDQDTRARIIHTRLPPITTMTEAVVSRSTHTHTRARAAGARAGMRDAHMRLHSGYTRY